MHTKVILGWSHLVWSIIKESVSWAAVNKDKNVISLFLFLIIFQNPIKINVTVINVIIVNVSVFVSSLQQEFDKNVYLKRDYNYQENDVKNQ